MASRPRLGWLPKPNAEKFWVFKYPSALFIPLVQRTRKLGLSLSRKLTPFCKINPTPKGNQIHTSRGIHTHEIASLTPNFTSKTRNLQHFANQKPIKPIFAQNKLVHPPWIQMKTPLQSIHFLTQRVDTRHQHMMLLKGNCS